MFLYYALSCLSGKKTVGRDMEWVCGWLCCAMTAAESIFRCLPFYIGLSQREAQVTFNHCSQRSLFFLSVSVLRDIG